MSYCVAWTPADDVTYEVSLVKRMPAPFSFALAQRRVALSLPIDQKDPTRRTIESEATKDL
ncbi:hypothetical protein MesoLj131a_30540 [Mesorhizobium sp. 131-2-1]|nr:hypothetical protein MesoLj131a_30540 [Mesorhizobium sp. 131-2-1]